MKTHLDVGGRAVCKRGANITRNVYNVTCLLCTDTSFYRQAKVTADVAKQAAFEAQEPRKHIEPWHQGQVPMVCKACGNDTFREADRTCYGHYANFVCAGCGLTESRLTEKGMSF
jgi:hypothetical protein